MPSLLSCADPLQPRRTDPHFAPETAAAQRLGATIGLIDHDLLLTGDAAAAVRNVPRDLGPAWYRGWMIPSRAYAALAEALAARGTPLLTHATAYRTAHELPGWYETFAAVTPASRWLPTPPGHIPDPATLATLAAPLGNGPGIVKDYVKSAKHAWETACYIPDLADTTHLHRVVTAFLAEQGDHLAGGIVLRSYEPFGATRAAEARVWWLDGAPVLVTAHPDTPTECPAPPLDAVAERVVELDTRFLTTDLALRADGVWRVVEVGDGQVSDLPGGMEPGPIIRALLDAPEANRRRPPPCGLGSSLR
ncbi:ATP-grasp domain-containing protein [Nocardia sp. CDC159]|uniref:ATP-grasp domain-containing protein n=1 Tax=Nocardia pulmonis TaxID=2951408 RepID=A0A9X2EDC5_9NOCA|nr:MULTISPECIES: ATP-grasp domain-containing protein [Nocardia]MCM6778369.1 ATP-grasp domain-containing protein [Nocardia pulmonis]MCM6791235.1 ATP-grasp domain-containing protein [Nocardia sp. CDC159]